MTPGMGMGPGTGMEPGAGMGMMPGAGMWMMPGAGTMGAAGTLPGPIAPLPQGEVPGAVPGTVPGLGMQRPTAEDYLYTQGYLTTQIGRNVRIEFLVGDNTTTDRRGTLVGVGIDYVLLRLEQTDDLLVADLYSIKFVTTYL
ncbi:MAG: hypothetical protein Q8930_18440 [Bacillota bacterium]|nr:hypothetical protein [Bacillota bacterium]